MQITLRPWTNNDIDFLVTFGNNPAIFNNMTDAFPSPYEHAHAVKFITFANSNKPTLIFAILADGAITGSIGLHPQTDIQRKNMELGYWIAEPYWGKGIATGAVKEIIHYCFNNFEVDRIFSRPFGTNLPSQKVLEKAGFTLEARLKDAFFKNNTFVDELIYVVRRSDMNQHKIMNEINS